MLYSLGCCTMHTQAASKAVSFDSYFAENLGELARPEASIEFHLPQSFLGVNIALGKKQVIFVLGINMRHTITIGDYFNWLMQALKMQLTFCLGKWAPHQR